MALLKFLWNQLSFFYVILLKSVTNSSNRLIVLQLLCLNLLLANAKSSDISLHSSENFCLTRGCRHAANLIKKNINEKENPCNNFHAFACGGFLEKPNITKHRNSYSRLSNIKDKVQSELKKALEESIKPEEPRIYALVKTYYKACKNAVEIERYGLRPILDIINDLGGWPVALGDSWDESNFDWMKVDTKLRHHGFNPKYIFNIFVFNDLQNSTKNILYISPLLPHLTTATTRKGFRSPLILAYHNYMTSVARLFGADKSRAAAELKQSVLFETQLVEAIYNKSEAQYEGIMTVEDLKAHFPFISWSSYLNELLKPVIYLKDSYRVKVRNPYYLANLENLLKTTPKRVIANYMIWRAIAEAAPYLNRQIFKKYFKFQSTVINIDRPLPTWKTCLEQLTDKTGLTVGISTLYVNKYFNDETKAAIKPVLHLLVEEFQKLIKKSPWMDEASKQATLRKSEFMKHIIAYPNELLNQQVVEDYLKDLEITPNNHLKNRLNLNRFHFNYALSGLKEATNKRLWVIFSDSTVINAYYYPVNNAFALLAAILQPPIFNPRWPAFAKFASIGFLMGHEMMHAYDRTNSQLNEFGSLKPLLSPAAKMEYDKRSNCFIEQYNNFIDEEFDMAVDGDKTLNENLADNLGFKIAHLAYQTWQKSHDKELNLPHLKYTADQMFWIVSVNILCSKATELQRINLFLTNVHTPDDFRTFGIVSNSPQFAKSFNCSKNSPMNPEQKCELW